MLKQKYVTEWDKLINHELEFSIKNGENNARKTKRSLIMIVVYLDIG